jgi:FMN reductase
MGGLLIVGIGGTTRSGSGTERILRAALASAERHGADTLIVAGPDLDLPMYAPGPRGARALALISAISRADGLIVASPAYHGTISGLIKNALDHVEDLRCAPRPYLDGRAVGCIATSAGTQAGASTLIGLRSVAHALRGWPTPLGVAVDTSVPVFSRSGRVVDAALLARLDVLAEQVVGFAEARAPADRDALVLHA